MALREWKTLYDASEEIQSFDQRQAFGSEKHEEISQRLFISQKKKKKTTNNSTTTYLPRNLYHKILQNLISLGIGLYGKIIFWKMKIYTLYLY